MNPPAPVNNKKKDFLKAPETMRELGINRNAIANIA
jgi:hypothetical protein